MIESKDRRLFSVIIPTMWRSDYLSLMLPIYQECEYVGEIILIDNDPSKIHNLPYYPKLRYYSKGENIYVNPAWNWGVELANYEIILANDDILIDDLDRILRMTTCTDFDIIGMDVKHQIGAPLIKETSQFPMNSWGCFMYVKKYTHIPDEIKIWGGDNILFLNAEKRGSYRGFGLITKRSSTIGSEPGKFGHIRKSDTLLYNKYLSEWKNRNILHVHE